MIKKHIEALIAYGLNHQFFEADDVTYMRNRLCSFLKIEAYDAKLQDADNATELQSLLFAITKWAVDQGQVESTYAPYSDLFDTELLDILCPKPSDIVKEFIARKKIGIKNAVDWYYDFSKATNYIRMDRVAKNVSWTQPSVFGDMVMTINLSKPEKDPKSIVEAAKKSESAYPKCLLCYENIGYEGRLDHPARQTHRVIPMTLAGEEWFMQYSPYVYYNEHAIVINKEHVPMKITKTTYERLCDFLEEIDYYFIGSNADLPVVGGSMLSHDHYQAGNYEMPMARASERRTFGLDAFGEVTVKWLEWPLTVLRVQSKNRRQAIDAANLLTDHWKNYSDERAGIRASSGDVLHHTVTPIARKRGAIYELDVVLRSNICSELHPDGVYHPHREIHPIKRENIGLIEVMGLAVLPARLKAIADDFTEGLRQGLSFSELKSTEDIDLFEAIYERMTMESTTARSVDETVKSVIGQVFIEGLEHAGVMKLTEDGEHTMEAFMQSVNSVNGGF